MKTRSLILAAAITAIVIVISGAAWFLMGMR